MSSVERSSRSRRQRSETPPPEALQPAAIADGVPTQPQSPSANASGDFVTGFVRVFVNDVECELIAHRSVSNGSRTARFYPHATLAPYAVLFDRGTQRVLLPSGVDGGVNVRHGASYTVMRFVAPSGELSRAAAGDFQTEPFLRPRTDYDLATFTIAAAADDAVSATLNRFGAATAKARARLQERLVAAAVEAACRQVLALQDGGTGAAEEPLESVIDAVSAKGRDASDRGDASALLAEGSKGSGVAEGGSGPLDAQRHDIIAAVDAAVREEWNKFLAAEVQSTREKTGASAPESTVDGIALPHDVALTAAAATEVARSKEKQTKRLLMELKRVFDATASAV